MSRSASPAPATFTRPGNAQSSGPNRPVHGAGSGLYGRTFLAPSQPPLAPTPVRATAGQIIQLPQLTCPLLWRQVSALYFPL
jgi:hypothetical protein